MVITTTKKQEIINRQMTKLFIFTSILFFGGLILIPVGIGFVLLPLGILGFIGLCLMPIILPNRIKSCVCPSCSIEIFWLADKTEKGLNCPTCQKRLLIKENQLECI